MIASAGEEVAVAASGLEQEILSGVFAEGHGGRIQRVGVILLEIGDKRRELVGRGGSVRGDTPRQVGRAPRAERNPQVRLIQLIQGARRLGASLTRGHWVGPARIGHDLIARPCGQCTAGGEDAAELIDVHSLGERPGNRPRQNRLLNLPGAVQYHLEVGLGPHGVGQQTLFRGGREELLHSQGAVSHGKRQGGVV